MRGTAKKVLAAALKLPVADRVELVEELLADLDGPDEDLDAAWAAEVERRTQQIDEGKIKPVTLTAVRRRIARQVGGRS